MRTNIRSRAGHLHATSPENGERPPSCQRRALKDDHHEIDERFILGGEESLKASLMTPDR